LLTAAACLAQEASPVPPASPQKLVNALLWIFALVITSPAAKIVERAAWYTPPVVEPQSETRSAGEQRLSDPASLRAFV
jgi:hypothetical protein